MGANVAQESIPLSNRQSTILGVSISFQAVAILSVLFRLYIRFRLMKSPGWDDLLVTLAVVGHSTWNDTKHIADIRKLSVTTGTVFVCLSTHYGLGQHFASLSSNDIARYIFHFYIANGTYSMSTALIKLSVLFQYLRIFDSGPIKKVCVITIVLVAIWGTATSFMAWFPCFPIRAYWDWSLVNATCYAYGSKRRAPFVATYEAHSALNLIFDIAIFITPISIIWHKQRSRREHIAILGLFALGSLVIAVSSWRLATVVAHQAGWKPQLDFTFYAPISILLACLEVYIAVFAASMPIFWPLILRVFHPIYVTQEIQITHQAMELEDTESIHSQTVLHGRAKVSNLNNYKGSYAIESIWPIDEAEHPANRTSNAYGKRSIT